ncbi:putative DASH complex subunit Ask1 [Lyophyllum shimeji]|uniref:DASH complex subunit ASK1 n=1 Tax=Lyophyllum shimeji TaxID=47721 RepID=A0A9P3PX37_LYOSH|nr:putative DASH complex subunit Ask1 [Lyophyllum shimeji]
MRFAVSFVLAAISIASAAVVKRDTLSNVHLAVNPNCGTLSSGVPADVNAGLPHLNTFKTIVSFGDAYSDDGVHDGSTPQPAILSPPNPKAGGRMSNGPVWVENLAKMANATVKDYAASGAVVDASQYPGSSFGGVNDMIGQIYSYIGQANKYDPDTTLYTIFFGMDDFQDGGNLDLVAQNIAYHILALNSSPVFAKNILVVDNYGRGTKTAAGEAYKQEVFSALQSIRGRGVNVGFVDFSTLWTGVLGPVPGYKAFGYTNPGACLANNQTTVGACSDPDHSFYWMPGWRPNPDTASIHVPGLDTSAPVLDQIEQIEQLITLKLQNIDENFSKIHHVLANKILPSLKRYTVATEPVREAAKFWTSFYEQAAQIRIPSYDDYSTVNEESRRSEQPETASETTQDQSTFRIDDSHAHAYEPSMTSTDGSFMPGHAAFSSTPATTRVARTASSSVPETADDPSWTASLDSPLVHMGQDFQRSSLEDETILGPSTSNQAQSLRLDEPTPNPRRREDEIPSRSAKGKAKDTSEPLLRNVLRHNLYPIDTSSTGINPATVSPLKYRGKPRTPIPKKHNPFLPADKDPADWDGVVDLRDPSIMTPQRQRRGQPSSHRGPAAPPQEPDDDDSFDGLPPGMSPPVMMSPARPPRSLAELGLLKLGQTPTKEASARITRDLVRDIQYQSGNAPRDGYLHSRVESTLSTVPTPPSLSRYHRYDTSDSIAMDSSLESMMRRVGLNVPGTASTPGLRLRSHEAAEQPGEDSFPAHSQHPSVQDDPMTPVHGQENLDMDSDSDSLDDMNNTAHPGAPFILTTSGHGRDDSDDSFGSSNHSGDSLAEEEVNLGLAPVHPFGGSVENDGFDDSFDDDSFDGLAREPPEETLFGVPPRQRMQAQQRAQVRGPSGDGLRLLGEDLLQDTIGIGAQIALNGGVEDTPTPAGWSGASRN